MDDQASLRWYFPQTGSDQDLAQRQGVGALDWPECQDEHHHTWILVYPPQGGPAWVCPACDPDARRSLDWAK